MEGFEQERRGLFDGLQVPHSLNAIIIAATGLLVYWLGIVGIENAHSGIPGDPGQHCRLLAGMLGNVSARMGTLGQYMAYWGGWTNTVTEYDLVVWFMFIGWTSATWAFFSGAINRIAAMKLAREESIELREALKFGARKFVPNLLSIVFVLAIVGFFYLVCNATIAGWIGRIPVVGDVLLGLFYFLVLIASFLVVFAATLGALGFNLASSAIATESSDTFDGVSRAWNYILARPWTVLLTYLAIFAFITLILFCGNWFLKVSVKSLSVGPWGLGGGEERLAVDDEVREALKLPKTMKLDTVFVPAKGEYLYKRVLHKQFRPDDKGRIFYRQGMEYALERYKGHSDGKYPPTLEGLIRKPETGRETWFGPYLDPNVTLVPKDPWDRELVYEVDPDGYKLGSVGPDGQPGTGDDLTLEELEEGWPRHGPLLNVAPILEGGTRQFLTYAVFFWIKLIANLFLYGYVVAYFFSAQTTVYFLLRKDVEGDAYTEVVLEEEPGFLDPPPAAPPADAKKLPTAESDEPKA